MFKSFTSRASQNDLQSIFRDMRKCRWKKVSKALTSSRGESLCCLRDPSGLSLLSVAAMSMPPLDILQLLLELNPAASLEPDDYGSIPLHLACLNGASSDIIRILLEHDNGISASVPDLIDGRVPLHHAVEFAARIDQKQLTDAGTDNFDFNEVAPNGSNNSAAAAGELGDDPNALISSSSKNSALTSSVDSTSSPLGDDAIIIRLLCQAVPEMVHFKSHRGETPIDIAYAVMELVQSEEDKERIDQCYSILKQTAVKLYKKKKREWESKGYVKEFKTTEEKSFLGESSTQSTAVSTLDPSVRDNYKNDLSNLADLRLDDDNKWNNVAEEVSVPSQDVKISSDKTSPKNSVHYHSLNNATPTKEKHRDIQEDFKGAFRYK